MLPDTPVKRIPIKLINRNNGSLATVQNNLKNFVLQLMGLCLEQVAHDVPGLKHFSTHYAVHGFAKHDDALKIG